MKIEEIDTLSEDTPVELTSEFLKDSKLGLNVWNNTNKSQKNKSAQMVFDIAFVSCHLSNRRLTIGCFLSSSNYCLEGEYYVKKDM